MNHIRNPLAEALLSLPQGEEIIRRVLARIAERKAMNPTLRVKRLTDTATLPVYAKPGDAGMDLCADGSHVVPPWSTRKIPTGIAIEMPDGYEGQVRPRSGRSLAEQVAELGTVDAGYRGEVAVIARNKSATPWRIARGDRIAQLVIAPVARCVVVEADALSETERGASGFGSTGVAAQAPASSMNEPKTGAGIGGTESTQQAAFSCVAHDGTGREVA